MSHGDRKPRGPSDWTLDEWAAKLDEVYGYRNRKKRSPSALWMRAVEDGSQVGEAIREGNYWSALRKLTHAFIWICGYANVVFGSQATVAWFLGSRDFSSISDAVWLKYPDICGRCEKSMCVCVVTPVSAGDKDTRLQRLLSRSRENKEDKKTTLREWARMFERIFELPYHYRSLTDLGFHYLEELGEVCEETRRLEELGLTKEAPLLMQLHLVEEIADSVSWTFTLFHKIFREVKQIDALASELAELSSHQGHDQFASYVNIETVLWHECGAPDGESLVCYTCKQPVCRGRCEPPRGGPQGELPM